MTAECLKAIADLYFNSRQKSEAELDICLSHYAKAIKMFKDLGKIENKESILTVKYFGMCHRKKGNLNDTMDLLKKAGGVAEKELEADHKWKVWITGGPSSQCYPFFPFYANV